MLFLRLSIRLPFQLLRSYHGRRIFLIPIFLPNDEFVPGDLQLIEQAEQEYAKGETISHKDRNWQTD
jgi:hypothetical protein